VESTAVRRPTLFNSRRVLSFAPWTSTSREQAQSRTWALLQQRPLSFDYATVYLSQPSVVRSPRVHGATGVLRRNATPSPFFPGIPRKAQRRVEAYCACLILSMGLL
jgi:hypothetical protein